MAQLRDKQTSQVIAEGTPLEVALAARELGPDEVLFDDVGHGFDPEAVVRAHEEELEGLAGAAKDRELDDDARESIKGNRAELQRQGKRARGELARGASKRLEEARARVERG